MSTSAPEWMTGQTNIDLLAKGTNLEITEIVEPHLITAQVIYTWPGGELHTKCYQAVEWNGREYRVGVYGCDSDGGEATEDYPISLWAATPGDELATPSGEIVGAFVRRDGLIFAERATANAQIYYTWVDYDGGGVVICPHEQTQFVAEVLSAHGMKPAICEKWDLSISRLTQVDARPLGHVSQLIPDLELDPEIWGDVLPDDDGG